MKERKVPMRTCVVSRTSHPKNDLTRVVVNKEGEVFVDATGKMNGRGAYLLLSSENIANARKKKVLEKILKVNDLEQIYLQLERLLDE